MCTLFDNKDNITAYISCTRPTLVIMNPYFSISFNLFLFIPSLLLCQPSSSRYRHAPIFPLAGVSSVVSGIDASRGNPAGLADARQLQAQLSSGNYFQGSGIKESTLALSGNLSGLALGVSIQQYGLPLAYKEQALRFTAAKRIGASLSAGAVVEGQRLSIPGYGNSSRFIPGLGIQWDISPVLRMGILYTGTASGIFRNPMEQLLAGLRYAPSPSVELAVEVRKAGPEPLVRAGIQYLILERCYLRAGIDSEGPQWSYSSGYLIHKKFRIDLALRHHAYLGRSWATGITFQ
jgi:hypothetical protein